MILAITLRLGLLLSSSYKGRRLRHAEVKKVPACVAEMDAHIHWLGAPSLCTIINWKPNRGTSEKSISSAGTGNPFLKRDVISKV